MALSIVKCEKLPAYWHKLLGVIGEFMASDAQGSTQDPPNKVQAEVRRISKHPMNVQRDLVLELIKKFPRDDVAKVVTEAVRSSAPDDRKIVAAEATRTVAEAEREDTVIAMAFSPSAYGVIEELMRKNGTQKSLSTVLRDALAFEKWYRDAVAEKVRVLVDRGKGDVREVNRP